MGRHLAAHAMFLLSAVLVACGGGEPTPPRADSSAPAAASAADRSAPVAEAHDDAAAMPFGESLARPELYWGLYAKPESPDRQWFVTEARRPAEAEQAPEVPPGHLAIGAKFGDVAPWHRRTLSETEFEQVWVSDYQPGPITVEFELDADGRAVAMRFTDEQMAGEGRLVRQGELPEDWR